MAAHLSDHFIEGKNDEHNHRSQKHKEVQWKPPAPADCLFALEQPQRTPCSHFHTIWKSTGRLKCKSDLNSAVDARWPLGLLLLLGHG